MSPVNVEDENQARKRDALSLDQRYHEDGGVSSSAFASRLPYRRIVY